LESTEGWKLVRRLLSDLKAGYEDEQGTLKQYISVAEQTQMATITYTALEQLNGNDILWDELLHHAFLSRKMNREKRRTISSEFNLQGQGLQERR
jgi:hypothetical protein